MDLIEAGMQEPASTVIFEVSRKSSGKRDRGVEAVALSLVLHGDLSLWVREACGERGEIAEVRSDAHGGEAW